MPSHTWSTPARTLRALGIGLVVVGTWLLAHAIDNPNHPLTAIAWTAALALTGTLILITVYTHYGRPPRRRTPDTPIPAWGSVLAAIVFVAFFALQIYLLTSDPGHRATSSLQAAAFLAMAVYSILDASAKHRRRATTQPAPPRTAGQSPPQH